MRIEKCNTKSACNILHEKPTTTDHHHGIKQRKFNTPLKQHKTLGWILPTTTFEPLLGNLDVCKRQGLHHVQRLWHALTTSYKPRSLCFFWEIYSVLSCPFICFCAIQSLFFGFTWYRHPVTWFWFNRSLGDAWILASFTWHMHTFTCFSFHCPLRKWKTKPFCTKCEVSR